MSDYGAFRDLQRHRLLSIDWQPLTTRLGYDLPDESGLETYYGAVRFDGVDLDDLTLETDAFVVRQLPARQVSIFGP